jgi:putative tricarboxylic transport membrane protein
MTTLWPSAFPRQRDGAAAVPFAMHNIIGGPRFIAEQRDLVYAIILGNLAQAALLIVVGIPFVYAASRIVRVPMRYLIPSVMVVAIFGSYALTGNASGPVALLFFAILGWVMSRFDFPVVATVIGLMLGDLVESELIRSYQISGGDLGYLFERPVAIIFLILLLASLATPLLRRSGPQGRRAFRLA